LDGIHLPRFSQSKDVLIEFSVAHPAILSQPASATLRFSSKAFEKIHSFSGRTCLGQHRAVVSSATGSLAHAFPVERRRDGARRQNPIGRATIELLRLNRDGLVVNLRRLLANAGERYL
jgi:hypothetical protein